MNNGHDPLEGAGVPASRPSTPDEVRRGKTDMLLAVHEGMVIVRFPQPMAFIAMEPENARNIAEGLARAAYEAKTGQAAPPTGSEIAREARDRFTERVRLKLITRLALVMNGETFISKAPKDRARTLVDIIMTELA